MARSMDTRDVNEFNEKFVEFANVKKEEIRKKYINEILEYFKNKSEISVRVSEDDKIVIQFNKALNSIAFIDIRMLSFSSSVQLHLSIVNSLMSINGKDITNNDNYLKELDETIDNLILQANEFVNLINNISDHLIDLENGYLLLKENAYFYIKNQNTKKILLVKPKFDKDNKLGYCKVALSTPEVYEIELSTSDTVEMYEYYISFCLD